MGSNVTFADGREIPSREAYRIDESQTSGVSWGAVFGGAFVAAAFYLILLALGAGLGLSAISPWSNQGISGPAVGVAAIIWLLLIEIIASGLGGYLAGRLRTKWATIHTDEVYFRDTANGFLAWCVALVLSATFLASAATSMVGNSSRGTSLGETTMSVTNSMNPNAYFVDALFRSDRVGTDGPDVAMQAEASRILANALRHDQMPAADHIYLARLVAAKTGVGLPEAEKRVSDVLTDARQAEDTARHAAAHLLLWLFIGLLMGAFTASYAATIGGRQRDHVKVV